MQVPPEGAAPSWLGRKGCCFIDLVSILTVCSQCPDRAWSQVLKDPSASDLKRAGHQQALRRELDAVRRLSGALNVAAFEAAFEDDDTVYILTELCKGGELWHRIGEKHYSERTVSAAAFLSVYYPGKPVTVRPALQYSLLNVCITLALQVASYMRAVLRTLAQFHSHHLLHRDVKPGGCIPMPTSL